VSGLVGRGLLLFHLVLVPVPDEVGAELGAVQVVRLTLVVEPHLLQILAIGDAILPWHNFPKQKCKF